MPFKYFPDVRAKVDFSLERPQPQSLYTEGQIKVFTTGLKAGQSIPIHPDRMVIYTFLEGNGWMVVDGERLEVRPGATIITQDGANRGIDAESQLIFLATRISELPSYIAEDSIVGKRQKDMFSSLPGNTLFRKGENISEEQNRAIKKAFRYILQKDFYGGYKYGGNYLIAYSVEFARNLIFPGDGSPQRQSIHQENAHIGIAIHDETDLHFISGLTVTVTITDHNGIAIGSFKHPLLRRPNFRHYGRNWILPGDGKYSLQIRVETPVSVLRNEKTERTYITPIEVEFHNVTIRTGRDDG
ncbi:MAG TPA: iron transporter [Anaerolinea sp.]|nr:iron transporter [Anaerolinea sp.]